MKSKRKAKTISYIPEVCEIYISDIIDWMYDELGFMATINQAINFAIYSTVKMDAYFLDHTVMKSTKAGYRIRHADLTYNAMKKYQEFRSYISGHYVPPALLGSVIIIQRALSLPKKKKKLVKLVIPKEKKLIISKEYEKIDGDKIYQKRSW